MTLYMTEIAWGIDRRNGGYKERISAQKAYCCEVGKIADFGVGRRLFAITQVEQDHIVLLVHYENNPSADKSWTIHVGEKVAWAPRSFDGGHKYEFELR